MQEVGQVLRQAREEKGMTLEGISSQTMIAKKYLRALEEGEFALFPGEVYLKGALRKYASELGLNPEEMISRYEGATSTGNTEKNERETEEFRNKPVIKRVIPSVQAIRSTKRLNKRRVAMVLVVLTLLVLGIRIIAIPPPPQLPVAPAPPAIGNDTEDILPPEEQISEPEPPLVRVERDSQDPFKFNVINAATIEVLLSFKELSWVRVHADGVHLFEGTFAADQTRSLTARESMRVRTGNALGTIVVINGEAIALPQARNPVTLEISAAGFE